MRALLPLSIVGCLLLVSGCRSQYHKALVGAWHNRGDQLNLEFKRNGTFKLSGPRGALDGNYSTTFRDYVHLTVDKAESGWAFRVSPYGNGLGGPGGSDPRTGTIIFEYKLALRDDQNTLILTDRDGTALTFQRVP